MHPCVKYPVFLIFCRHYARKWFERKNISRDNWKGGGDLVAAFRASGQITRAANICICTYSTYKRTRKPLGLQYICLYIVLCWLSFDGEQNSKYYNKEFRPRKCIESELSSSPVNIYTLSILVSLSLSLSMSFHALPNSFKFWWGRSTTVYCMR
jgi:hypothetical protein